MFRFSVYAYCSTIDPISCLLLFISRFERLQLLMLSSEKT